MMEHVRNVLERSRVILLATVCYAAAGLVVALPVWQSLENSSLVQLPNADEALWAPGGLILVEWLRLEGQQVSQALNVSAWLVLVCGLALLFPIALLFWGLTRSARTSHASLAHASFVSLPPFTLLWGITYLARACLIAAVLLVWQAFMSQAGALSKPWLTLGALCLLILCWSLPGLLQDLARAWVVARGAPTLPAIGLGLRSLAARPLATLVAYLAPNLAALGLVLLTLRFTDLTGPAHNAYVVPLTLLGHNACLFVVLALRALWYEQALNIVLSSCPPTPDDTRADSDAPADPNPSHDA